MFPVLMLAAARRRGDLIPAVVYRGLGHPAVLGGVYAIFLAVVVVHGLVIWQTPWLRAGALGTAAVVVLVSVGVLRRGAFARQAVVAIRTQQGGEGGASFAVVSGGAPLGVTVEQSQRDGVPTPTAEGVLSLPLRDVRFRLPPSPARDLKVIAQAVGAEGVESLPVVRIDTGDGVVRRLDPRLGGGQVSMPLHDGSTVVDLAPDGADGGERTGAR